MTTLVWTNKLSVGNVVIDAEHRKLMCLINDIIRAIQTRDYLTVKHELEYLDKWLRTHFTNEEKIAQTVDFPFDRLKPAQQYSLDTLRRLMDELEAEYGMWSISTVAHFSCFLKQWIIEHITRVDMPMKPMLQAHDYNFWPGYAAKRTASAKTAPYPYADSNGCKHNGYLLATGYAADDAYKTENSFLPLPHS